MPSSCQRSRSSLRIILDCHWLYSLWPRMRAKPSSPPVFFIAMHEQSRVPSCRSSKFRTATRYLANSRRTSLSHGGAWSGGVCGSDACHWTFAKASKHLQTCGCELTCMVQRIRVEIANTIEQHDASDVCASVNTHQHENTCASDMLVKHKKHTIHMYIMTKSTEHHMS